MARDEGYNGWTNYETWAVALWIDNEEGSYNMVREMAREIFRSDREKIPGTDIEVSPRVTLARWIKDEMENSEPDLGASMWADLLSSALSVVDWYEIADHYLDDIEADAA